MNLMIGRRTLCLILILHFAVFHSLFSQEKVNIYKEAVNLFEKEKYGASQKLFEEYISSSDKSTPYLADAEYFRAICAMQLFHNNAEELLKNFIVKYPQSHRINDAYYQMGNYHYRKKRASKTLEWLEKVDRFQLREEQINDYYFKLGYSYFKTENLDSSKVSFFRIKDNTESEYALPAQYYYAHIHYLQENYQTSLNHFVELQKDDLYAPFVPYYIAQIYYLLEDYQQVVEIAPALLDSASTKRVPEIARIIGESYTQLGNYKEALPYLDIFQEKSKNLTSEDKYLIAYTYYKNQDYETAAKWFKKLGYGTNKLSQNAVFHLADCHLKTNEKDKAKAAFSEASKMTYDEDIAEMALWNYAKLTYELSYSPFNQTIKAFDKFIKTYPESEFIDEAYDYLVKVYLTTHNYQAALKYLDKIQNKDNLIQKAYQRVAYMRALELFSNLSFNSAIELFSKSLQYQDMDKTIKANCFYWTAESYYRLQKYKEAESYYKKFIYSSGAYLLPEYTLAHYNLGYAAFKQKDYESAISWFRKYTSKNKKNIELIGDAYIRTADCYFVNTDYYQAIKYFDLAISVENSDVDYAYFQKAFALGLVKEHSKKSEVLQTLIKNYPESAYLDDAYFELGKSYLKQNMIDEAISNFEFLIAEFPKSNFVVKSQIQLGLLYYNANNADKALDAYKNIVSDYPNSNEAKTALIGIRNIYLDEHNEDEWFTYVESLGGEVKISVEEQDSLTFQSAEKIYMLADYEKAAGHFEKYISKFPDGASRLNANYYLADSYTRIGETEKAVKPLKEIIRLAPNDYVEEALSIVSDYEFSQKNYPDAIKYFALLEQSTDERSNLLSARTGLMRSYRELKNDSMALFAATSVLITEKVPGEIANEAHFIVGKSYLKAKEYNQALGEFKIVAEDLNTEIGAESKFRIAEIYNLQNQPDLSEKEIFDFNNKSTPHIYWQARAIILLADLYMKKNDLFMAKHSLQSIIDNYENKSDGIIYMAQDKFADISEKEEAEVLLEESLEFELNFDESNEESYEQLFEEEAEPDSATQAEKEKLFRRTFTEEVDEIEKEKDSEKNTPNTENLQTDSLQTPILDTLNYDIQIEEIKSEEKENPNISDSIEVQIDTIQKLIPDTLNLNIHDSLKTTPDSLINE